MMSIVGALAVTLPLVASFFFGRRSLGTTLTIGSLLLVFSNPVKAASRDFYRYDLGGTIGISSQKDLTTLRSFLWKHWIQHKRGIVVTVVHGVDTPDCTVSYFVEPNAPGGDWRIVIESRRNPLTHNDSPIPKTIISDVADKIGVASKHCTFHLQQLSFLFLLDLT